MVRVIKCRVCGTDVAAGGNDQKYCEECRKESDRKTAVIRTTKWRRNNREKVNETERKRNRKIRLEVLSHYSNGHMICACCGEQNIEFLCIDHINGGGNIQRRELKHSGQSLFPWLKRNKYPDGYRVLCYNCNNSIGFYGYCPHKEETDGTCLQ